MSQEVMARGQCQCGGVNIEVKGVPVRMAQCHCRDCQRSSGAGHASNATFKATDVAISGTTANYATTADSGNILTRHFCATCGGRLFIVNSARPGMITVAVGAFDDSSWFKPQAVLYTRYRARWDRTAEDVPCFEGMALAPKPQAR